MKASNKVRSTLRKVVNRANDNMKARNKAKICDAVSDRSAPVFNYEKTGAMLRKPSKRVKRKDRKKVA